MNTSEEDAKRLIELLSKGWDGCLTESDNAEIDAFLRRHGPEAGELLLNASTLHLELGKHVAATQLFEKVMTNLASAESAKRLAHREASSERKPQAASARRSLLPTLSGQSGVIAALAAALLVAVGLNFVDWRPRQSEVIQTPPRVSRLLRPSKPVANLVAVHQAVWAEGSEVELGQTLPEKQRLELLSGSAQLSMACGADIVLQAPCAVTLVSNDYAKLESGKLTAQAAEWATGFSITCNDLRVTDLGTRFALSADDKGIVEAHVLEGSVLAEALKERLPQPSSMLLKSGQAIRVDGLRSEVNLIAARRNDFVDKLEQFRPLRPISIWNTGVGSELGSDDPHWRITAGSDEFGPYPRQATITDADTGSYKDNRPDVSQWISVSPTSFPGAPPESVHTYETTFDLTGYDIDTVYMVGYFLVDDAINELRINGHPVKYQRWVTTWDVFDFKSFHPIEIVDHFVPGENVVSIDVFNSPSRPEFQGQHNPTALRVEWQAFGCTLGN
ncbi:MAG: hypothetical protein KDA37_04495 [Planctomycetales bacterium]|nr:hypothetical protein [Planctomycetales bacterium]